MIDEQALTTSATQAQPEQLTATGYTRVYDELARALGLVAAAVYGRVWWYARGPLGRCVASQGRIANDLGLSRKTVNRKLGTLIDAGYITDLTGTRRYRPHELLVTDKLHIPAQLGGTTRLKQRGQPDHAVRQNGARGETGGVMLSDSASLKELNKEKRRHKIKEEESDPGPLLSQGSQQDPIPFSQMIYRNEIRCYHAITGRWPFLPQAQIIIDCMQQHGLTEAGLKPFWTAWVTRGHNPRNLAWLVEWAVQDHIPQRKSRNARARSQKTDLDKYTSGEFGKFIVKDTES